MFKEEEIRIEKFKKKLVKKILTIVTTFLLITGLINGKIITYADTGDITLSVENKTLSQDQIGPGVGPILESGELESAPSNPKINIYFTDFNGNMDGQVSINNLLIYGGVGNGIFHSTTSDEQLIYDEYNYDNNNLSVDNSTLTKYMVIKKEDGTLFDFKGLKAAIFESMTVVIEGYRNNSLIGSVEYVNSNGYSASYLSMDSGRLIPSIFGNVDMVKITGKKYLDSVSNNMQDGSVVMLDTGMGFFAQSVTLGDPISTTHTLTYTAGTHGTISGISPQTVNNGASGSVVTAVADTGYHL